ncbi:MAG: hypothetical protein IT426_20870 [Pirellulales bacterium]|nr:hypothetical protein [Pirellulales bacterium]
MKPGSRDEQYKILIAGRELEELRKFTWSMADAFGLDRRIEKYRGVRPLGLSRWDLDCLESILDLALDDEKEYPEKSGPGYEALKQLADRIKRLREEAYAEMERQG